MKDVAIIALSSYLLGSIPFGYILVRLFLKQDIRATGSGNIGATNVARSGKKGLAIATLLLDAGKGALAVAVAMRLIVSAQSPTQTYLMCALAAFCAVCGHVFPIWLRFRGGKGVATGVGGLLLVCPKAVLISIAVFALVFAISRYVSAASVASAVVFPIAALALVPDLRLPATTAFIIATPLLIIAKHHSNIRRLAAGTEPKFGIGKSALPANPIEAEKNA